MFSYLKWLKWLNDNRVATFCGILAGGIVAALTDDGGWGIIAGTITVFLVTLILAAGWADALIMAGKSMPEDLGRTWQALNNTIVEWKNAATYRKEAKAFQKRATKAIRKVRAEDKTAEQGWQIMGFFHNTRMTSWFDRVFPLFLLILHAFLFVKLVSTTTTNTWAAEYFGDVSWFWSYVPIHLIVITLTRYSHIEQELWPYKKYERGSYHVEYFTEEQLRENLKYTFGVEYREGGTVSDEEIESQVTNYLRMGIEARFRRAYSNSLQSYISSDTTMVKIMLMQHVRLVLNFLWAFIAFPILLVLYLVFVSVNDHTRLAVITATLIGCTYLTTAHLYLGGIHLGNSQFMIWLLGVAFGGATLVHWLTRGGLRPFKKEFDSPKFWLLKI